MMADTGYTQGKLTIPPAIVENWPVHLQFMDKGNHWLTPHRELISVYAVDS